MSWSRSRTFLALLAAACLAFPTAMSTASAHSSSFPDRIELPDGFQPEGIAIGRGPTAWFGSLANGDIYAANLRTGDGDVISPGPGTPSVGLKVDRRGRLFVAGGPAGNARVVDTRTGDILRTYQFTSGASFVNDVVLTRRVAWFTDSMNAVLYGVPVARNGRLGDPSKVRHLPLTGDWAQTPGFNANGIARTPDREALLVIQSSTGLLFRVNPRTGVAEQVDLDGAMLTNGDGLLVVDRTLYVVQNQLNQVAVVDLDKDGEEGEVEDTLTSDDFDVPTTVAKFRDSLYLPNARFRDGAPEVEFWATRIDADD